MAAQGTPPASTASTPAASPTAAAAAATTAAPTHASQQSRATLAELRAALDARGCDTAAWSADSAAWGVCVNPDNLSTLVTALLELMLSSPNAHVYWSQFVRAAPADVDEVVLPPGTRVADATDMRRFRIGLWNVPLMLDFVVKGNDMRSVFAPRLRGATPSAPRTLATASAAVTATATAPTRSPATVSPHVPPPQAGDTVPRAPAAAARAASPTAVQPTTPLTAALVEVQPTSRLPYALARAAACDSPVAAGMDCDV